MFLRSLSARLLFGIFILCWVQATALGALIPEHSMNEWAHMSDTVVYCQEESVDFKEFFHKQSDGYSMDWNEVRTVTNCRVLQSYKGNLALGQRIMLDYDSIYRREDWRSAYRSPEEKSTEKVIQRVVSFIPLFSFVVMAGFVIPAILAWKRKDNTGLKRSLINLMISGMLATLFSLCIGYFFPPLQSPGRCLVFLKDTPKGYGILTAKLVINNTVYRFSQASNPGPLVLSPQRPENIELTGLQSYGEQGLLKDINFALKKPYVPKPAPGTY